MVSTIYCLLNFFCFATLDLRLLSNKVYVNDQQFDG